MAERVLPGVGLKGFDDFLSPNWNDWTDENWRIVSALLQGRVKSATTPLPGSPVNGDIYIVPSGGNAGKIAIRDAGSWIYLNPLSGWRMYSIDSGLYQEFDGSTWSAIANFTNLVLSPPASVTPTVNGEMTFQLTSDTSLEVKVKGSDGTVRSAVLALT